MPPIDLREPWRSFLHDLDGLLTSPIELQCLGGFVVSELYGLTRSTADIDVLIVGNPVDVSTLVNLGGESSALARKHRVHVQTVPMADVPENYAERLIDYEVAGFARLRLRALERHDLALSKLTRNSDRDREDIQRLATGPGLDAQELRSRYSRELRPLLGRPDREDTTLDLWIEIIEELQARKT